MRIHAGALPNVIVAAVLCASPAVAQTGVTPGDADAGREITSPQLEQIEVLGSHIRRVDIETQHPLLVLERADIERTGLTSISDVVQSIVANGETLNRNINNGAKGGEQQANLRSLGANRTLVLLNGQRFVTDIGGAVDLSAIPLALVERVEVLLDGASAIYGSDAIAGVINIITRRNYEGAEIGAYYAQTSFDDGKRRSFDFGYGHKAENWSASAGIEYSRDDPVYAGDRAIAAVPFFGLPPEATGSPFTPYSWLWRESYLFSGLFFQRLLPGKTGASADDYRFADPSTDLYNFAPVNYLQTPQQRRAAFAQARYELSANAALNVDVLFNQRTSRQQLAPSDILLDVTGGTQDAIAISADNVYNPFGEPIDIALRRLVEAGPRTFEQTDDTWRVHAGLDGLFTLLVRDFSWGIDVSATRSHQRELTGPYADDRKLAPALGPSFIDAAGVARCGLPGAIIADCVPLNLFGPPGSITPAMLDYIDVNEVNRQRSESNVVDAHVSSGALVDLPAGPLGFAAGIDHRRENGADLVDPLEAGGYANGNGQTRGSTRGAYSVSEAYVEFDAPLLAGQAFARKLDLTLGSRYSRYSNFGSTTNSQLGLRWRPVDDLLVRANFAQGFRAPAVSELFAGAVVFNDFFLIDPCDAVNHPTPAVRARCSALGVPADVDSSRQAGNVEQAGNPDLRPETARSRGAGFVYTSTWLEGFDASLDWYDVRVRNAIGDPGYNAIVADCYLRNDDAACTRITRNPGDGTIFRIRDLLQNAVGGIETAGYDIELVYRRDTPIGRVSAHWNVNYVDYFGEIGRPRQGTVLANGATAQGNVVGLNSPNVDVSQLFGVIWRWRSQLRLAWDRAPWSASITGRYFSHIDEDCSNVIYTADQTGNPALASLCSNPDRLIAIGGQRVPENRVASVTFTDIEGSWEAPWQARITLGVRNAFNRSPPVSYSAFANSFFPDYDLPGRFWHVSYRQKF